MLTHEGLEHGDALEAVYASPPSAEQLEEIARWIAPEDVPVRFDARYFAVAAPEGLETVPDGSETAATWWVAPRRLLEDWRGQRRLLFWPTYVTVEALATCDSVAELLALRIETREPDEKELERLPRSIFWQD